MRNHILNFKGSLDLLTHYMRDPAPFRGTLCFILNICVTLALAELLFHLDYQLLPIAKKWEGFPDPCDHFLVVKVMTGLRKNRPQGDLRLPISLQSLTNMLAILDKCFVQSYVDSLFFRLS